MISFDADQKIFYSSNINDNHYYSGFATKELGNAKNTENILNFFNTYNIPFSKIVILRQIHSTNILFYKKSDSEEKVERIEDTDGLITKDNGVVLIVRNADCVPMIFVDKKNGLIGISHQGWRGSLRRMAVKMLEKLLKSGAKKDNLRVAIGPSINDCCYDIDDDRYYAFIEEFDGYSNKIFHFSKGKRFLNLAKLNYLELINSGIKEKNIDHFPFCTKCDHKRFFSRRRVGHDNYEAMFNFVVKND